MSFKSFIRVLVLIQLIGLLAAKFVPHSRNKRIANGIQTSIGSFPYQVSLRFTETSKHFCGGAILTNQWIVTAAQCTQGSQASVKNIYVVVGATNITAGGLRCDLEKIVNHPAFNWEKRRNDISLLKTNQPMQMGASSISPVSLPSSKTDYIIENGIGLTTVTLTGWGSTKKRESDDEFDLSQMLRYQDYYLLQRQSCRRHLGHVNGLLLSDGNLCTSVETGKGMGSGDVGSPLVTRDGELVGIASWSSWHLSHRRPDVYTRVYPYISWIWGNLNENNTDSSCTQ